MTNLRTGAAGSITAPLPWQLSQWAQLSRGFSASTLAHAYLLCGSEGLGKSLFAGAFAKYALCMSPIKADKSSSTEINIACGECKNCLKCGVGNHPDIIKIELEEGSKNIKIDQIRWLSEFVIRSSHSGGAKIAIIEQAHLLNGNAANALLKTLEEPNDNTHLFLVSDYPGRLVATIRSRCQKLSFPTPSPEIAIPWLQESIGAGNVEPLIKAADGRPLIALELAEGNSLQATEQLLQTLCEMKLGRKTIQQALALASKIGESEVLEHFSKFLSKLTKYSLTGDRESEGDPAISGLYSLLETSKEKPHSQSVASALAMFYSDIELARRQLASSTNPNPQLIMESILWQWSMLKID